MEFPSNILLKYFSPSKWISRIMVSWGIITICTAAVTTYEGLLIVRIFLGLAEAGFFPGFVSPVSKAHKTELTHRPQCHDVSLFLVQARRTSDENGHLCIQCCCRGCLRWLARYGYLVFEPKGWLVWMAMVHMDLSRCDTTRYSNFCTRLFILEGIPAVIVGVMVWFWLPDCTISMLMGVYKL